MYIKHVRLLYTYTSMCAGDGFLARDEFITVMRERQQHGLNRPKDMGFTRALNAFKTCTAQSAVQLLRAALPDSAEHVEHNK